MVNNLFNITRIHHLLWMITLVVWHSNQIIFKAKIYFMFKKELMLNLKLRKMDSLKQKVLLIDLLINLIGTILREEILPRNFIIKSDLFHHLKLWICNLIMRIKIKNKKKTKMFGIHQLRNQILVNLLKHGQLADPSNNRNKNQ